VANQPLKPKDLVTLLRIYTWKQDSWTFEQLSAALETSTSQVYYSLERAEFSHLYDGSRRRIRTRQLVEFASHGVRYAFAAHPGPVTRGIPTASTAPAMTELLVSTERNLGFVWPHPAGQVRGQSITPLAEAAPALAQHDEQLYAALALIDSIRIGSAREREVATNALSELLAP
jgi:hypothetical protein